MTEQERVERWGAQAREARPFLDATLSQRFSDLANAVCRAGIDRRERDEMLCEMRVIQHLAQQCGIAIIEARDALKVEID